MHRPRNIPNVILMDFFIVIVGVVLNCVLAVLAHAQCVPNDLNCMNLQ